MQPIKIEKVENGYIIEMDIQGESKKWILSKFAQVIEATENHFKDQEYINEKLATENLITKINPENLQ